MDSIRTFFYQFLKNSRLLYVFSHPMSESWAATRKHLTVAIQYLPRELGTEEKLKNYNEYLSHNELELSLDTLIELAQESQYSIPSEFWHQLIAAAVEMKLQNKAAYLKRFLHEK
jgi:hypothetical protein